jgi:lambda family phage portal protein
MAGNVLDRLIGYVSPRRGANRLANRRKIELIDEFRKYEAASQGRRLKNWRAPATSADVEISTELPRLRNRARDLVRNNAIATAIITKHADYIVGSGIMPRFKTGTPSLDEILNNAFDGWAKQCDPEGVMDYYGKQYQACREMVEGGEAFVRKRLRRADDMLIPLQLQTLESDLCDVQKNEQKGKGSIRNGIEYDGIGRRRGYYIYDDHPGSGSTKSSEAKFVKADQIAHLFDPQRTQNRGVPWLTPVMVEIRDLHEYNQTELIRKKIEACNVAVVLSDDGQQDPLGVSDSGDGISTLTDANGQRIERFEPGMVVYAKNSKDVRFNTPAVSQGMEAYIRTCERRISAGARIPYQIVCADSSQSNFASGKLDILTYQRFVENFQWHYFIPQWCEPTAKWFLEAAVLAGMLSIDAVVEILWNPPEFASIDRLDDAKADLLEVRIGKRTPQEMIAKTGRDPQKVLQEFAEWNAQLDDLSITLDSDPRKMSLNGQIQLSPDAGAADVAGGSPNAPKVDVKPAAGKVKKPPAKPSGSAPKAAVKPGPAKSK